jgi:hypothetical protein
MGSHGEIPFHKPGVNKIHKTRPITWGKSLYSQALGQHFKTKAGTLKSLAVLYHSSSTAFKRKMPFLKYFLPDKKVSILSPQTHTTNVIHE